MTTMMMMLESGRSRHHPLTCASGSRSVRHPGCRCLPLIHVSGPRHSHHYHRHHNHYHHHHHHHHYYHHRSNIVVVVACLSYQPDNLEDTTIISTYLLIAINDSSSKQHWIWSAKHECFGCGWWVCSLTMGKLLPLCVHSMYTAQYFFPLWLHLRTLVVDGYSYHSCILHYCCSA